MKKPVAILATGVLVVGIVAWTLWWELHDVRAQAAQWHERTISSQSPQLTANPPPAAAPDPMAAAPEAVPAKPEASQLPAAAATEKPGAKVLTDGMSKVLASAEGKDLVLAQMRMMLPQQYPDLAKELGLSLAEEEKFFDILARQQASTVDVLGALGGNGQQPDPAALQEVRRKAQEAQKANEAELNAMLGSKLSQWQEYQNTLPIRRQVDQLQTALGSGNALSDSQSKALISLISAEKSRIGEDRRNTPQPPPGAAQNDPQTRVDDRMRRMDEDNARLLTAASSQLNPQQLEGYRQMLDQQQQQLRRTMLRTNGQQMPKSQ